MRQITIELHDISAGSYVQSWLFADNPNAVATVVVQILGEQVVLQAIDMVGPPLHTVVDRLRPIPITADWLINLGFSYNQHTGNYQIYAAPTFADDPDNNLHSFEQEDTLVLTAFLTGTPGEVLLRGGEDGNIMLYCDSVHRLQAVVWLLEGVWLTLPTKEVNRD